jgi:hypothetical protein
VQVVRRFLALARPAAPAGSIAVFSSVCFHRSGPNRTSKMRCIYLPQYSAEPILSADGSQL